METTSFSVGLDLTRLTNDSFAVVQDFNRHTKILYKTSRGNCWVVFRSGKKIGAESLSPKDAVLYKEIQYDPIVAGRSLRDVGQKYGLKVTGKAKEILDKLFVLDVLETD